MNRQSQKNLLVQIANFTGIAGASTLLSLPAMALASSPSKIFARSFNSNILIAQSKQVSQKFLLVEQSSDNPATNTGSRPTTVQTEKGVCQIPPRRPNGGNTRRRLQAQRNCNPGSETIPSNTNSPQKTPASSPQNTPSSGQ